MKVKLSIFIGIFLTFLIIFGIYFLLKVYKPEALIPFDQFGKIPLCNRKIERGIVINGFVLPFCCRCTFMILFFALTMLFAKIKILDEIIKRQKAIIIILITIILIMPLGIDGVRVYFFDYLGHNYIRMITGSLFGMGVGIFTHYLIYIFFEKNSEKIDIKAKK